MKRRLNDLHLILDGSTITPVGVGEAYVVRKVG